MKKILKKFKIYFIFIGIVFISTFIFSLFNLIGISKLITNILAIITMIITFIIFGYLKGKNSNNKGYIQGFKIGSILIIILLCLSLFSINFKTLLYYVILLLSSIFGAMIGINKK